MFTYAIRPVPVGYMFLAMFFAVLLYVMAPTIFQPIRIDALLIFVMGPQIIVWPDNGIAFGVIAGACVATAGIHALYYWFGSMNSMGNTDPE